MAGRRRNLGLAPVSVNAAAHYHSLNGAVGLAWIFLWCACVPKMMEEFRVVPRAILFAAFCASAAAAQSPPAAPPPPAIARTRLGDPGSGPPVSPRRAFFYSALLPGLGQAALDRRYSGAAFFLIEAFSLAVVYRSADDLRLAKAFLGDSVPSGYDIDPATGLARRDPKTGDPVVLIWKPSGYTNDLVRARRLQLEDWLAVVVFNHLIAGADAFVAANLWDLPQHVSMRAFPAPRGAGLAISVSFR
ncbi:MAG TPA: hypothetical protein VHE78_11125 [Gemmatimonadaceae bacterium]|nr:hypothetical protein [Gemmatimonadaceae bacterium]